MDPTVITNVNIVGYPIIVVRKVTRLDQIHFRPGMTKGTNTFVIWVRTLVTGNSSEFETMNDRKVVGVFFRRDGKSLHGETHPHPTPVL